MKSYHNFIGIDIGKFSFVVNAHNQQEVSEYENSSEGIGLFLKEHKNLLKKSLCILETTGGHEIKLLYTLCDKNYAAHRANTRKVKNFIRSYGNVAKTDKLDAKALAKYGYERHKQLDLFAPQSKLAIELYHLVQRRSDLTQILVAEKNRFKAPGNSAVKSSCQQMINMIKTQIDDLISTMQELINRDKTLYEKQKILKTIPGIGEILSLELLILLPELGTICRRKIASLAGLAPISNDSGAYKGYRRTGHGRNGVKPRLFLAAMAARNSKSELKQFYEKLITKGKKKLVALTALMRKILVIANAKLTQSNFV